MKPYMEIGLHGTLYMRWTLVGNVTSLLYSCNTYHTWYAVDVVSIPLTLRLDFSLWLCAYRGTLPELPIYIHAWNPCSLHTPVWDVVASNPSSGDCPCGKSPCAGFLPSNTIGTRSSGIPSDLQLLPPSRCILPRGSMSAHFIARESLVKAKLYSLRDI